MLSKYGNCTCLLKIRNKLKLVVFANKVGENSRYFAKFSHHSRENKIIIDFQDWFVLLCACYYYVSFKVS